MSQDGDLKLKRLTKSRSSLDNDNNDLYEEEIVVEDPPGLEKHCPKNSLKDIYHQENQA